MFFEDDVRSTFVPKCSRVGILRLMCSPSKSFSNLVAFTAHFITANPWLKGTDPLKVRGFEKVELGSAFPKGDAAKRSELLALAQHQQEEPASHCGSSDPLPWAERCRNAQPRAK